MASYGNMKLPPNLDKPPLFNSGYRVGGSEINKPALPRTNGAHAAEHDLKVPKVENELYFSSDLPSFKRPKFTDESLQLQTHYSQRMAVPLLAKQRSIIEHDAVHRDEDGSIATRAESTVNFNPLSEPSPLGLSLRKSPSLLDLIQRKLAQNEDDGFDGLDQTGKTSTLGNAATSADKDKLKAANFPASKLRIATWECTSRYDGDLVAKCYYAKRKLVWEVLHNSLKSKMEVQWSDISALKAVFPDDQPAVLDIELSRPPLFFREINPQPRKHTLWQSTSDFTDGHATICRHHSVQFPVGVLNRHFEKLLQCDVRLKALNEQTRNIIDSCFFDNRSMQIDRQHMLHYQAVLADHAVLPSPLTVNGMKDEAFLQPAAVRALDCCQGRATVQGLQNEPLEHSTSHPGAVESIQSIMLEGMKSETPQRALPLHGDVAAVAGVRHRHGGLPLQFATAESPSSVIDQRVLNESSSSSETEEAHPQEIGRSEIRSESLNVHVSQEVCRPFSPLQTGPIRHPNGWTSRHFQESAIGWDLDNAVSSSISYASEQQVLNALSMHLLGEPISSPDPRSYFLDRTDGLDVHEMLGSAGAFHVQSIPLKDSLHKHDRNLGNCHHGHLNFSQWNPILDQRALDTGSSSLVSHGSYVDLVYLPRVASQPQFLEPAP